MAHGRGPHPARCGIPTASDRILASRLGTAAVEVLADGEDGVMVGIRGPRIERLPLEEGVSKEQPLDSDLYRMAEVLTGLPE
jgi:6-phosphofructokinase 1